VEIIEKELDGEREREIDAEGGGWGRWEVLEFT
jgi:hypothetical protein